MRTITAALKDQQEIDLTISSDGVARITCDTDHSSSVTLVKPVPELSQGTAHVKWTKIDPANKPPHFIHLIQDINSRSQIDRTGKC